MAGDILLAITGWELAPWIARFRNGSLQRAIRSWPDDVGDPADISYVCAWKPPPGVLQQFPNVRAIFSLGAGVDHLIGDATLPLVPITRIVHGDLTQRMTEYVVLHTLMIHRQQRRYDAQQRERVWRELDQPAASEVSVGVMGIGVLGSDAVALLARIGFQVTGWSRTPKTLPGVETFHGDDGLDAFLARTEILIVLLPLTPATRDILTLDLLRKLRRDGALGGAHLINAGRGGLQVDADIVAALDQNILASATLDVFPREPLSADSPLWRHPRVTVTPHAAAASDPKALVDSVLAQIARLEAGQPLATVIDRAAGY